MSAQEIAAILRRHRFAFHSEAELQTGIAAVLRSAALQFECEVRLSDHDRIDFLTGDVGIEVKTRGSAVDLIRQLHRYAQSPRIAELLVVSSRCKLVGGLPGSLNDKPIIAVSLAEDFL